jgi:carbonic anhydrase
MHLHGTSEHTVNGGYYPLEAHLVHIPAGEALNPATVSQALVIGVFLSPGAKTSNKVIDIIQHYPGASPCL